MDQWVTQGGTDPLPLEEEHCSVVEVTEEDIQNSVKFVPSLSAVVRNPELAPFTEHFCVKLIHLPSSFPGEVKPYEWLLLNNCCPLLTINVTKYSNTEGGSLVHLHRGQGCLLTLFNTEILKKKHFDAPV